MEIERIIKLLKWFMAIALLCPPLILTIVAIAIDSLLLVKLSLSLFVVGIGITVLVFLEIVKLRLVKLESELRKFHR